MIDRVIVTGSRIWPSFTVISSALKALNPGLVIHGNARGADQGAHEWAIANERQVHVFPAQWKGYGRQAGHLRNGWMLDAYPNTLVIAFPYGEARGTRDCVQQALERGHEVRVFDLKGNWENAA